MGRFLIVPLFNISFDRPRILYCSSEHFFVLFPGDVSFHCVIQYSYSSVNASEISRSREIAGNGIESVANENPFRLPMFGH